ncbi:unnamed protein product [Ilex paraguariensis]|uniref:Uncharacterized protein n=1 Tax=Ilex paraguariensis TaxID=185542 RepID=A0ABC8RM84_9AQUA
MHPSASNGRDRAQFRGAKTQRCGGLDKARAKHKDGSGEGDGGGAAECVALGDAVHRASPSVVYAVLDLGTLELEDGIVPVD